MTVIYQDRNDTAFLKKIYEGLEDTKAVVCKYDTPVENRMKAEAAIRTEPDRIAMLGHGTQLGLLNPNFYGYVVNGSNAHMLKDKNVIAIWCWAGNFMQRQRLTGFSTSMFISEENEALYMGFPEAREEDIHRENDIFSERVRALIDANVDLKQWPELLRSQADMSKPFVKFNYDGLSYYYNGIKMDRFEREQSRKIYEKISGLSDLPGNAAELRKR